MNHSFRQFVDRYIVIWNTSSLTEMIGLISTDYKAREIRNGEIVDFGYEASVTGWEQGFKFARENKARWILNEVSIIPLKEDEAMVIIAASMELQGKKLRTANLFFQTFKKTKNNWRLVRSYIEAGLPVEHLGLSPKDW